MDRFRANNLEEVIMVMDEHVRNFRVRGSRLAYFLALYRTTTHLVKKYCDQGDFFENPDQMRRLDTIFANFYFDSLYSDQHYDDIKKPSESWKVTFDACDDQNVTIMQHLLVGMNAHISLDLGVAAAMVADGKLTDSFERDFNRLNLILSNLVNLVQIQISTVSPVYGIMSAMSLGYDRFIVDRAMAFARSRAWRFAEKLSRLSLSEWDSTIKQHDKHVARISHRILYPPLPVKPFVWAIRQQEASAPHEIISGLAGDQWHKHAYAEMMNVIGVVDDPQSELMKRETHLMRAITPADLEQS